MWQLKGLPSMHRAMLAAIQAEPGEWSTQELADDLETSTPNALRILRSLEKKGLVTADLGPRPSGKGPPATFWFPGAPLG